MQYSTISSTRIWFETWLQSFGGPNSGIWQPENLTYEVAIPYVKKYFSVGPVRIRGASGTTNDHTPRYDILGELPQPEFILKQMMDDLDVTLLSFSYLSTSSKLLKSIQAKKCNLLHYVDFCESSPYVDCTLNWDQYWNSRGKTKSTWKRKERKLMKDYGAKFECITEWKAIEPLLPRIFEIEASGWKGKAGTAIMQDPQTHAFYKSISKEWADRGEIRLYLLILNESPIAFQLNVFHSNVLYHIKVGYLEEHNSLSPGQVLQLQILRHAFNDPDIHKFDLLGGGGIAAKTKLQWATNIENLYTLYIIKKNIAGILFWIRLVILPAIKSWILKKKPKGAPLLPHPVE